MKGSWLQGRKPSEVSLENHPQSEASLDSLADSAFGGPGSVKSVPTKTSPASPRPPIAEDFGFGESAFRSHFSAWLASFVEILAFSKAMFSMFNLQMVNL